MYYGCVHTKIVFYNILVTRIWFILTDYKNIKDMFIMKMNFKIFLHLNFYILTFHLYRFSKNSQIIVLFVFHITNS